VYQNAFGKDVTADRENRNRSRGGDYHSQIEKRGFRPLKTREFQLISKQDKSHIVFSGKNHDEKSPFLYEYSRFHTTKNTARPRTGNIDKFLNVTFL